MARVETAIVSLGVLLLLALVPVVLPVGAGAATCTTTVASVSAVTTAVDSAAAGTTVCLADGKYGRLVLTATKAAPGVVVRAENPGGATIAGATLAGANVTLAQFQIQGGVVELEPAATGMTIDHNLITGGSKGIDMPTSTTQISDTRITGNKFVGPFGEDAIRANRFHDGDGDGVGLLIEGNEFTNIRENGQHSDCLQTVWVGDHLVYRRNYVHDNRCQGFFVKDQASAVNGIVAEDNLMLRNAAPCDAAAAGCGQPSVFQVFGPVSGFTMRRNTIWTPEGGSPTAFQNSGWANVEIDHNVVSRLWTSTDLSGISFHDNTSCSRESGSGGSWPSSRPGDVTDCSPPFADPAHDDYRTNDGRGVTWAPADQHYGPGGSTTTPPTEPPPTEPPPTDTTPPGTSISSGPSATTTSTSASFAFTATQAGSTFECKLDAGAYAACTSPKAYSDLGVGAHTFSVRATDPAGNTDATPATRTWTIAPADVTPPDTTITSGPDATTLSRDASFAFTASDAGATFECKLDASSFAPCSSPKQYSGLSTGAHTFSVRASDAAGNADATPAAQTWTIAPDEDPGEPPPPADAPPTAELNAPASGTPVGERLVLTPNVADDRGIDHVEFWLDDALLDRDDRPPFRTWIDRDRIDEWTHTISLRVFDSAGQAVSTALRLRVVRYGSASPEVRLGATLSSAPFADGLTRLQGQTTPGSGVMVSLTPCASQAGNPVDRFALRSESDGSLELVYARGAMCVLELGRLQR
jgi:hypothetical protein